MTAVTAPAVADTGSSTGVERKAWLGLALTPIALALLGFLLWRYVNGADKDFQEASALEWGSKLEPQLRDHITLTLWSTLWVLLIAVPLGVVLTRPRLSRLGSPLLTVANSGQAIPAYGLFVIIFTWIGTGASSAIVALVIFTVLPVLRNTMVGLEQVNQAVIEAGRGMGMTRLQALRSIELPLAVPVILAGVRTALVINVGMASLAFLIGGGGLGVTINSGIKLSRDLVLFTGAAMTALLALSIDWLAAVIERVLRPKGL
ncbi:MAG: ABC transporter permease [Acidimicrobiales bacterium]